MAVIPENGRLCAAFLSSLRWREIQGKTRHILGVNPWHGLLGAAFLACVCDSFRARDTLSVKPIRAASRESETQMHDFPLVSLESIKQNLKKEHTHVYRAGLQLLSTGVDLDSARCPTKPFAWRRAVVAQCCVWGVLLIWQAEMERWADALERVFIIWKADMQRCFCALERVFSSFGRQACMLQGCS